MIQWLQKKIKRNLTECIEETFFRSMLIIAMIGCLLNLFFDVFLNTGLHNTIGLNILFLLVISVTLYLLKKMHFNVIAINCLMVMNMLITYRALITDSYFHLTCTLLITLAFISALITRGQANTILKVLIGGSLFIVMFKNFAETDTIWLIRQAIPYIMIFSIVTVSTGILKSRYEKNQQRLSKLIQLLNKKNVKIQEQNSGLLDGYQQLTRLNENLERIVKQKTYRIEQKNKQLAEIAYTNAHQVRGPLARILGLLQLIAMDPGNNAYYLIKIDNEATEMDNIIHNVARSIELNIQE